VIHEVEGEAEQLEDATLHAVQTLVGVERTFDFKSPVIGVDAIRMSPTRIVLVHERERATVFYIDDHGDMLRLGEFDTRDAEWVGRNAGKVYAGMRDGPLMQLSLESGVGFRWDKIKVQEPSQAVSRCACGEAIVEAPIAATVGRDFALQPEAGRFDYLLYKGKYLSEHLRGRARIRDGFWTADVDGTLVSVALYRQLKRGAEVLMENAMALMLVRVANGVYVAPGESRQQLEVLRAFGRREL
jgi:hypothetical protein